MKRIVSFMLLAALTLAAHAQLADVQSQIARMAKASRAVGTNVTNLSMPDADGRERQLSEWCGRGQYVLIDFWASWCGPCLRELPNVVSCYEQYHGRGFEIVGISFDNSREPWLAAVERLKMSWPQLSDLRGWKSVAAATFGINSIPANILVDPQGRIIALDLRGPALGEKLAELMPAAQ